MIKNLSKKRKFSSFIGKFRSYSFVGMLKYLNLKFRGKSILVTGHCHGCGTCCRRISLEGKDGWVRSYEAFKAIVASYPEYSRFEILGLDEQGFLLFHCNWCTPQGNCVDYNNRLPLCRNFPESSLVFSGGSLPSSCGYSFSEVVPFDKILKKELKKKTR